MEDPSVFTAVALPVALAVIMVSLGLELTRGDFRRIFVYPRGVAIGLINLCLVAPLLAFGIAELFDLEPVLAIGLVLLGASPGGTLANLLTHLARGDTALSVTLTAISSVGALLIVPLYLGLAAEHFAGGDVGDVSMAGVVARVFLITIVPLSIGMYLRERYPEAAAKRKEALKKAAFGAFVLVVVGAVASEIDVLVDNFADVALATLALNVCAMTVSFCVAKLARLSDRQATAIAMELGIHNATLAIAVAGTINIDYAIPAAVYSGFMFITAGLFARHMARRNGELEPAPQPA
ncbi:MAG: bile acid:sodium symporter family protein [Actinomycetota bacterium]|nr:bile acid:sodium symporter family protein [Actinomycetota bacterium]